jgi:hypothetical protein
MVRTKSVGWLEASRENARYPSATSHERWLALESEFFESELHLAPDPLSFSIVDQRLSHEYLVQ